MISKQAKLILPLLLFFLFGCEGDNTSTTSATLENNDWTLVGFKSAAGDMISVPAESASTLYFEPVGRRVSGTVLCNRLTSTYRASLRRISLGSIAVTEMACGPDLEGQARFVMDVLGNLGTYTLKEDTLELRSKSGQQLIYKLAQAITPTDDNDPNQIALDQNRALWTLSGIKNYQYTFGRLCYCLPEEDIVVTMKAGRIASAVYAPTGASVSAQRQEGLDTIEGLFDLIQESIDQQVYSLSVTYDAVYGYPTYIDIDYHAELADEEITYFISALRPL